MGTLIHLAIQVVAAWAMAVIVGEGILRGNVR